ELHRQTSHLDHPYLVPVFFTEQGHRAATDRFLIAHPVRPHLGVFPYRLVHEALDARQLVFTEWRRVREVEAETVGGHQRALLEHMLTEHLPKSRMQKVRSGVVALGISADRRINDRADQARDEL